MNTFHVGGPHTNGGYHISAKALPLLVDVVVVVVVVFLKFLLRQEIIVTRVNNSLSQMSTNVVRMKDQGTTEQT